MTVYKSNCVTQLCHRIRKALAVSYNSTARLAGGTVVKGIEQKVANQGVEVLFLSLSFSQFG